MRRPKPIIENLFSSNLLHDRWCLLERQRDAIDMLWWIPFWRNYPDIKAVKWTKDYEIEYGAGGRPHIYHIYFFTFIGIDEDELSEDSREGLNDYLYDLSKPDWTSHFTRPTDLERTAIKLAYRAGIFSPKQNHDFSKISRGWPA